MEKYHIQKIKGILSKISFAVDAKIVYIEQRNKNDNTLAKLNLTSENAALLLKRLKIQHYISGPNPDSKGRPGEVWEFKIDIFKMVLFIRILAPEKDKLGPIKCISFHEDFK